MTHGLFRGYLGWSWSRLGAFEALQMFFYLGDHFVAFICDSRRNVSQSCRGHCWSILGLLGPAPASAPVPAHVLAPALVWPRSAPPRCEDRCARVFMLLVESDLAKLCTALDTWAEPHALGNLLERVYAPRFRNEALSSLLFVIGIGSFREYEVGAL